MKPEEKRQVLYTVLSDYIEGDDLWSVMCRWQDHYSDKSQFELNAFLSDCRDVAALAANRSEIYRLLIGRFMKKTGGLREDPIDQMNDYRQRAVAAGFAGQTEDSADSWSITFSQVLSAVFNQLRSDSARMVKAYCVEQSASHGINKEFVYRFSLWMPGGTLNTEGVSLTHLRQMLNFIYIGVCEGLGPVDADRILSSAIRAADEQRRTGVISGPDPGQLLQL
jgi:hypothetical protein